MDAIHWTDWVVGPLILAVAIAPLAVARAELSDANQAYGLVARKSRRGMALWLFLALVGAIHSIIVLLAVGAATGPFGLVAFSMVLILVWPICWLLVEWPLIPRPIRPRSSLRLFLMCIAADVVILPYLAVRYAWLRDTAAAG